MITILHRGGGGVSGTPKSDYIICARPLSCHELSKVVKSCQKLAKVVVKSWQKLSLFLGILYCGRIERFLVEEGNCGRILLFLGEEGIISIFCSRL